MTPDEIVRKRLSARLERLRRQATTIGAEIEMTERYLAGVDKDATRPRLKFRKNSQAKWSIQGQVRQILKEATSPIRAKTIQERLRAFDPALKASTFRSHIKRMVDAGIIKREGSRGYYQLVEEPNEGPIDGPEPTYRRRIKVPVIYR